MMAGVSMIARTATRYPAGRQARGGQHLDAGDEGHHADRTVMGRNGRRIDGVEFCPRAAA